MTREDQELFKFNMSDFDWINYSRNGILGARIYLVKDPIETIPAGLRKYKMLRFYYYFSLFVLFYLVYIIIKMFLDIFM